MHRFHSAWTLPVRGVESFPRYASMQQMHAQLRTTILASSCLCTTSPRPRVDNQGTYARRVVGRPSGIPGPPSTLQASMKDVLCGLFRQLDSSIPNYFHKLWLAASSVFYLKELLLSRYASSSSSVCRAGECATVKLICIAGNMQTNRKPRCSQ